MSKPITVSIVGNAGPLKKSLEEADGFLGKFGGSIKAVGVAAAAGVGALAAGIGVAAKAAMDDQKSFVSLENTIRNVTGATHDQIKAVDEQIGKMSLATGVADDKLRPAFEALVRGTRDTDQAMSQMNLVLDISTGLQMDATTVADALAKAQQGNTKALKALSPEMAAMIKEGAGMNEILDALTANFDGAASAAANTFAGRIERLKVFGSELVEQFGYYLLPVIEKFATFIMDELVPAFQTLVDKYGPAVASALQRIGDFVGEKVVPVIRDFLLPTLETLFSVFATKIVPVIRDVAVKVFEGLSRVFDIVRTKVQENSETIESLREFFVAIVSFVQKYVAPTLINILGAAFTVVAKLVGPLIDVLFTLMGALADVGKFLLKIAGFVIRTFEGMVNGVIDGVNLAIRLLNKLPGVNISEIGSVSFGGALFGTAPTAPTAAAPTAFAGSTIRMDGLEVPNIPTVTIPGVETPPAAAESGGKGGVAAKPIPVDMTGFVGISPSTNIGGGGGGGFGAAMGTEALLDGLTGGVVNITVNTVTADANLPTLIVEALQTYNLQNGPVDVEIAA